MKSEIERLLEQMRNGDESAREKLLYMYYPRMYRFLYQLTGHSGAAEDLLQETYIKILKCFSAAQFASERSFTAWVYRIAVNCALNFIKKEKRKQVSASDRLQIDQMIVGSRNPDPEMLMLRKERSQLLETLIARLSPRQKTAVVLYYQQGFDLAQTASFMGCRTGTVKRHLFRGVSKIRRVFNTFPGEKNEWLQKI